MYLCLNFVVTTYPCGGGVRLFFLKSNIMGTRLKRSVKSWGLDIIAFVAIFVVVQLIMGFIAMSSIPGIYDGNGAITDFGFMAMYTFGILPILIVVTRYESWRYRYSMPIKASLRGFDPVFILWGVILLFSTNIALTPITSLLPESNQNIPVGGYSLFTVCVLAPIFEELIFRGRLFSLLSHSTSALISASFSALLFGAVHGSPQVIVNGFVAGLIFSYAYMIKGSIIAPIILHMCNNAVGYALIILSYQEKSVAEILSEQINWPITYSVSLVIALLGAVHVVRTIRRKGRVATKVEDVDVANENGDSSSPKDSE